MTASELDILIESAWRKLDSAPASAEMELRALATAHPDSPVVLWRLALVLHFTGRSADAIELLKQAAAAGATAPILNDLGRIYASTGSWALAEDAYRRAIAIDAGFALAYSNLGDVLADMARLDDATTMYERAIALSPSYAAAYLGLAAVSMRGGDSRRALLSARHAVELRPNHAHSRHLLAVCHHKCGETHLGIMAEQEALRLAPDFAAGWHTLGNFLDEVGRTNEAAAAYATALEIDPSLAVAAFDLAALGVIQAPPAMPPDYVVKLFDEFAPTFDRRLINELGYGVPAALQEFIEENLKPTAGTLRKLDIGCGTGLVGRRFRGMSSRLVGVDLSPGMLSAARAAGVYDELERDDVTRYMERRPGQFDLILAGDLLIYIGDVTPLFRAAATCLAPGGYFAFSVESVEGDGWVLRRTRRYAHSLGYIAQAGADASMHLVKATPILIRAGNDGPVYGHIILMRSGS